MCSTEDGAYAKIQMWLSAKWASARMHEHFQTNTKMGTNKKKSQHNKNSGTKLSGCESFECQHTFSKNATPESERVNS